MARSELVLDLIARDNASRDLKRVGDNADKTGRNLTKMGDRGKAAGKAVGLALGAAAIVAAKFAADSVSAYVEAEQASIKLDDALKRFPKTADVTRQELDKLNSALARKTRFDDDATASAQATIAAFGLTGEQIKSITPLVQDFAARTGRDLPSAADVLGKAMLGQGRALKEVGIDFKDTGTVAGNFEQVMAGLRTQVGGFAEKEGKTAAGQAEIMRNQFGEIKEEVGQRLLPILTDLGRWLLDEGIPAIERFGGWLSDNKETFKDWGIGAGEVITLVAEGFLRFISGSLHGLGYLAKGLYDMGRIQYEWAADFLSRMEAAMGWVPGWGDKITEARATLQALGIVAEVKGKQVGDGLHTAADSAYVAAEAVAQVRDQLNQLRDKTVTVTLRTTGGRPAAMGLGGSGGLTSHSGDFIHPGMPRLPWDGPDERTRILQTGERVLSRQEVAAGDGGGAGGGLHIHGDVVVQGGSRPNSAADIVRGLSNLTYVNGWG